MYTIYGDVNSGNSYKVKLLAEQLELPYEWVAIDTMKKEARTPEFLAMNPNGKIPVLKLPSGEYLPESNAILVYLATGSSLLPYDRLEYARVLQWLFFEQYSHEPYIATARFIIRYLGRPQEQEQALQSKMAPGYRALGVMETHLANRSFFVGERYSIADIALFAYTHTAEEGDFSLTDYPAIRSWIQRIKSRPRHVRIG